QNAVDDEGGEVLGDGGGLAQAFGEGDGGVVGGGRGGDAAHDLDQLHHRRRLHEMQADETVGPVGGRGQTSDRDRRGVGGQQGVGPEVGNQVGQNRLLDGLVLDRRLDDQIGLGRLGEGFGGPDQRQGGVGRRLFDQTARRLPGQAGGDDALGLG